MKKGFTLIELLAVISILGILAFITTYAVINIIKDTGESANEISIKKYVDIINEHILTARLHNKVVKDGVYQVLSNGDLCIGLYANETCEGYILELDIERGNPTSGTIMIENKSVLSAIDVEINGQIVSYNADEDGE